MISRGSGPAWESRQLVFTDIHRVDTNHLLKTSRRWDVGTEPETGADQLLLYGGQVVHSAMVVHSVPHITHLLTTASCTGRDVTKVCHFALVLNSHGRFEIVFLHDDGLLHK
jgi:hypothetical protein